MKSLLLLVFILPAFAAQSQPTPARPISSKSLVQTDFVASKNDWRVESDALDSDGDPEIELQGKSIEVSISETSTFPLITIDADEAVKQYLSMMKTMLSAEERPWPKNLVKPNDSACVAFVSKLYAKEELSLDLTCYLPYRGGTAIVQAKINPKADVSERKRLSALLGSIKSK